MSFEPQNDLERSLVKAASDPAHRAQFYKELSRADIFTVLPGDKPPAQLRKMATAEGTTVTVPYLEHNGRQYIPIYSSLARVPATLPGSTAKCTAVAMNAIKFMNMTKGAALMLNPGAECGKEFTPEEIAAIVDGSIAHRMDAAPVQKKPT